MEIRELRVNHIKEALGFDTSIVSLSWKIEGGAGELPLEELVIRLFEDAEGGWQLIWESDTSPEKDSCGFPVATELLKTRTRYIWTIEAINAYKEKARAQSFFETGKRDEAWQGDWISPQNTSAAILEKHFSIQGDIGASRLYICGLGIYECELNGKKISDEYLAPGYHSYSEHLQAQTYDLSEYLIQGENVFRIHLGEGWFKGRLGFEENGFTDLYGDALHVLAEIYIDRKNCILKTDESFVELSSPVKANNIYDGEVFDERIKISAVGFARKNAPTNCGAVCDRFSLPIKERESFTVAEVFHTASGDTVLDFGQNLTGWVEIVNTLPVGRGIRLSAGEILQNGEFYRENFRTAKAEFSFISDGKPSIVRPHFTFFGFRYMKLEYLVTKDADIFTEKEDLSIRLSDREICQNFRAVHLRSDFSQIGQITTGHIGVNRLFLNALWGQKGNFLDVPTDCPQRDERLGWTGDAQVFSDTACYNMYTPAFYRKYLWDMRADQKGLDGSVPVVIPRFPKGMATLHDSCPWSDAAVIIPWNVYRHYGDKELLREMYPGMHAWVDYQRRKEEEKGWNRLISEGFHFADWLALDNPNPGPFGATDQHFVASAYYYLSSDIVAKAAKELGYTEEAAGYEKLAEEIHAAIGQKYFSEGMCIIPTQTAKAISIVFGLSEEKNKEIGDSLAEQIRDNGGCLDTGFVGTPILCQALSKTGHHELAVDLLLRKEYPGWLYAVDLGATTIWERWNSVLADGSMNPEGMNSLNHYAYGSIMAWMYSYVCGIFPEAAGFKCIRIAPHPDRRLEFAKCSINTAMGKIACDWQYTKESIEYYVRIPFGAKAILQLPGCAEEELSCGEYHYSAKAV